MKFIIVFATILAAALAAPQHYEHHDHHDYDHAEILRYESDVRPDGYKFGFETSDGTQHDAEGHLKEGHDKEHAALVVHGSFSFVDKEGHKYQVNYVADEYGYQPEGTHLPHA